MDDDERLAFVQVTSDQLELGDPLWEEVAQEIEEFLSTHPKFHHIEFAVGLEDI